jgi:hypothetical protein
MVAQEKVAVSQAEGNIRQEGSLPGMKGRLPMQVKENPDYVLYSGAISHHNSALLIVGGGLAQNRLP